MIWKTRCLALLAVLHRFLKHHATIGELRAAVRALERDMQNDPE